MSSWKWYVYILECDNNTFYTGMTWQPDQRWMQHISGLGAKYTALHKPIKLVYIEEYDDLESARLRERQIKGWRQSKKLKLINGEWGK